MCKVSVIIPCYNQAQYLPDAVNSVIVQTYCDWECIIVNDESPDNTEEVYNKLWSDNPKIKYLRKINGGLSEARNYGIHNSLGKYILPLDADDKIGPNYLFEAIAVLDQNSPIKIVYCNAEYFGNMDGNWALPEFKLENMLLFNHIFCTAMYRKSDFLVTQGYDTSLKKGWEDWEFWLSLLENGGEVFKLQAVHFYYRVKVSSMVLNMTEEDRLSIRRTIYLNHFKLYSENLFSDPISLYEENLNLKRKCELVENSKYYKLGRFILSPVKLVYQLIKK